MFCSVFQERLSNTSPAKHATINCHLMGSFVVKKLIATISPTIKTTINISMINCLTNFINSFWIDRFFLPNFSYINDNTDYGDNKQ